MRRGRPSYLLVFSYEALFEFFVFFYFSERFKDADNLKNGSKVVQGKILETLLTPLFVKGAYFGILSIFLSLKC